MRFKLVVVVLLAAALAAGCSTKKADVDLSEPERVLEQFIQAQVADDRAVLDALTLSKVKRELGQALYFPNRIRFNVPPVLKSIDVKELSFETDTRKVYKVYYTIGVPAGERAQEFQIDEAISIDKKKDKWYVGGYVFDKMIR